MIESVRAALLLALESGLPYAGLRGLRPDPNLLLYLPAAVGRAGSVVPLSLRGNVLQLACATPHADVSAVRERFPRLALELCISPQEEIQDLLAALTEVAA